MSILIIAPHPDDESLGCGGAICIHAQRGERVTAVFLTSGEGSLKHLPREQAWRVREREAEMAAEILGISQLLFLRLPDYLLGESIEDSAKALRQVLDRENPESIYFPHSNEWHPDHRAALPIVSRSLQNNGAKIPLLLSYEVWTPLSSFDEVKDISPVMSRKLRAVRSYRSQISYFKYDRAVRGLNLYRGALAARCRYAEVFQYANHLIQA